MGRPGSTKPFAPEELAQLAAVTSNNFEPRPTTKLSRDEILGLVSQTVAPGAAAPVLPHREPVAAAPAEEARLEEPQPEDVEVQVEAEEPFEDPPTVALDAVRRTEPVRPTARSSSAGVRVVLLVGALLAIAATVTVFAL